MGRFIEFCLIPGQLHMPVFVTWSWMLNNSFVIWLSVALDGRGRRVYSIYKEQP